MPFRVASKFDKARAEKCPKCSTSFADFMEVGDGLWACYQCGTVFVPKQVRAEELKRKKEQLILQERQKKPELGPIVDEAGLFKCPECGKGCKSKLGLASHMRKYKKKAVSE